MITEKEIYETKPDQWCIIRIFDSVYKVFGSWSGGYLDGDSWKLNSGIDRIEEDGDYWLFYGYSGSCYRCHKKTYGISSPYNGAILKSFCKDTNAISMNKSEALEYIGTQL